MPTPTVYGHLSKGKSSQMMENDVISWCKVWFCSVWMFLGFALPDLLLLCQRWKTLQAFRIFVCIWVQERFCTSQCDLITVIIFYFISFIIHVSENCKFLLILIIIILYYFRCVHQFLSFHHIWINQRYSNILPTVPWWRSDRCRWLFPLRDTLDSPPSPETPSGWWAGTAAAGRPLEFDTNMSPTVTLFPHMQSGETPSLCWTVCNMFACVM